MIKEIKRLPRLIYSKEYNYLIKTIEGNKKVSVWSYFCVDHNHQ